ncbi:MAG: D-alanine--D-alanine ligase [Spirochaetaceae bacterium]|jgi:D-alanine-D-alanine ligase|nr:D-alanine--D-alanine ligase [Spirochaetaceae bacterium]
MGIRVGVFFGGRSVEHEISIISAIQAINALDKTKYDIIPVYITREDALYTGKDIGRIEAYQNIPELLKKSQRVLCVPRGGVCDLLKYPFKRFGNPLYATLDLSFPIVHGTNVEDGCLQGFLKTLSIPFVGCDVTASAVGMDKYIQKTILKDHKIPVLECLRVSVKNYFQYTRRVLAEIEGVFPYPLIVKPLNLGSSIGISKAAHTGELQSALEYTFQFTNTALVEKAVSPLKEINCAVLGDGETAEASECEEPQSSGVILSFEDKYVSGPKGAGGTKGMSGAKRKLPADISREQRETIRDLAKKTFQALGCHGVVRVDFLLDTAANQIWVNEINTIPGSLSFYLWEPLGIPYPELLDRLIALAFKRERENAELSYAYETDILSNFISGGVKGAKGPSR